MALYATTLQKGVKWYRKLGIELLLGISVVNAHAIYQEVKKSRMKIRKFRELLALALLDFRTTERYIRGKGQNHVLLLLKNDQNKEIYRSCKICYQNASASHGRAAARKVNKKSKYYCSQCPNKTVMCLSYFTNFHKNQ